MDKQPTTNIEQARLAALYEVSSRLGTSLDLTEVLNQVMDSIIQLTGAERGYLMLVDEETAELQTAAARNFDQRTLDGETRQISRTVIERAIATGQGILTNNAQEDDRFAGQQSVVGFQLRSIMCTPLKARGRTLGAVYVDNRLFTGVFKEPDLELLATFANQAAIAIENARLFTRTDQALERRVQELSLFQRIDQELNKSLDLNLVLNLVLDWAIRLVEADGGSIGLIVEPQEEGQERVLRLQLSSGSQGKKEQLVPLTHPVVAKVLAEKRSVLTRYATPESSIDGSPAAVQLAVPIWRDGVVTGIITLEGQHVTSINEEDISVTERLADRAAVAIKNASLYEAIHMANQAKSEFISLVTHELRRPMTVIKGYTSLMTTGMVGPLTDQQKQFLEIMQRNLERMSVLISDLSDINRIESGRMKFEIRPFSIAHVIEDATASLHESLSAKQQTLTIEIPSDVPEVLADPKRIDQVLSNLLSNAHKYTPVEKNISIQVTYDTHCIQVAVVDNGIGISEENQQKLFTQFFRAEDHAVREQEGWGLGLSIVKKMVEAQGGEITFKSQLGVGSTFTFTIPLAV